MGCDKGTRKSVSNCFSEKIDDFWQQIVGKPLLKLMLGDILGNVNNFVRVLSTHYTYGHVSFTYVYNLLLSALLKRREVSS